MTWDWNEVDGVTTLSAPAGAIQGPLQACLIFGVGRADETMTVAGITPVVEHLAFQPLGHLPYIHNGTVDTVCTRFMATGGPEDVIEFFRGITENLRDLPVDRLAQELQILQVEEQRNRGSQVGRDLSQRFGPLATGLIGWPEHGLKRVGPDDVMAWSHKWFTAGNAVLWTSGPLPEKLDLSALPEGSATARSSMSPSLPPPRTFVAEHTNLVSVSAVMERQLGVVPTLQVAYRRAYDRLRRQDAISYAVSIERVRLDAQHALVYLGADGSDGKYSQVFEHLVEVWDELALSGPNDAEWSDMQRSYLSHREHPQARVGELDGDAERQVLGLPYVSDDEIWEQVSALTPDQVRDDVAAVAPTLFGVAPLEVQDGAAGWSVYEPWSLAPVAGDVYQPIEGREEGTIVLGRDGVSWIAPDDRVHTIRWDDAPCAFLWDDGRRTVLGPTGEYVSLIPWCWRGGAHFTQRIDDEIDASRRIRLGEGETQYLRDPDDPQSTTDVRWLGSIVGARYRGDGVDVVIDTDGFFLLFSKQTADSIPLRLQYLGRSDRDTLLSADPRNRWVPQGDIELVELTMNARARLRGARRVLLVKLRDGTSLDIHLVNSEHVMIASNQFRRMLGPFFQA
jgi:zinc protease